MAFILADIIGGIVRHQGLMKQRARKPFETTAYGQELKQKGEKGTVDVEGRVGRYAGDVYGQAARTTAETRGRLYARGMGGSMAGQRALNEPGMQAAGMVAGERGRLEEANEQTRQSARDLYGRLSTEWDEQRRQEQKAIDQARQENISGSLIGAAGSAVNLGVGAITGGLGGAGMAGAMKGLGKTALAQVPAGAAYLAEKAAQTKMQQDMLNKEAEMGMETQQKKELMGLEHGYKMDELSVKKTGAEPPPGIHMFDNERQFEWMRQNDYTPEEMEKQEKIWMNKKEAALNKRNRLFRLHGYSTE